jgi:hypothetical protein
MSSEELQILKEFNRNVRWLKQQQRDKKTETWITAQALTKLTGWDKERMRRARLGKEIEFEKVVTGGYRYNIDSVNPIFLKSK